MRALELIAEGYRASEVARIFGVTPGAVSQWVKRARTNGGPLALLRRKPKGRESRLTPEQVNQLIAQIQRPELQQPPLTARRISLLIEEQWGIRFSRAQVTRILAAAGISLTHLKLRRA